MKSNNQQAAKTNELSGAIYKICLMVRRATAIPPLSSISSAIPPLSRSFSPLSPLLSLSSFISSFHRPALLPFNSRGRRFLSAESLKELKINDGLIATAATFSLDDTFRCFSSLLLPVTRIFVSRALKELSTPSPGATGLLMRF